MQEARCHGLAGQARVGRRTGEDRQASRGRGLSLETAMSPDHTLTPPLLPEASGAARPWLARLLLCGASSILTLLLVPPEANAWTLDTGARLLLATALATGLGLGVPKAWAGLAGPHAVRPGRDRMPVGEAVAEVREVAPYLQVISGQLDGALQQTEDGVIALIGLLNQMEQLSTEQLHRIQDSQRNGEELQGVIREKLLIDKQLGAILQMFVDRQEEETDGNLQRIQRLQEVKALAPLVDVIANVAQQTNFLAINAAIEAACAGPSGAALPWWPPRCASCPPAPQRRRRRLPAASAPPPPTSTSSCAAPTKLRTAMRPPATCARCSATSGPCNRASKRRPPATACRR